MSELPGRQGGDTAAATIKGLLLAFLLCFLPRLVAQLVLWQEVRLETPYTMFDASGLVYTALHDPCWPPLYSLVAKFIWIVSCGNLAAYKIGHAVLNSLIGPLVLTLAAWLNFSSRAAWLSVIGVACLPYYVWLSINNLSVPLCIDLMAATLIAFAWWIQGGTSLRAGLLTATVSFALFLTRPNAASTICFLYMVAAFCPRGTGLRAESRLVRHHLKNVAVSVALLVLFITGWSYANLVRFGHFSPLTANGGYNLYVGNNPLLPQYAKRYDMPQTEHVTLEWALYEGSLPELATRESDPYARDRAYQQLAIDYMSSHPWETLRNMALKSMRYWDVRLEMYDLFSPVKNAAYTLPYLATLLLGLVGGFFLYRQGNYLPFAILTGSILSYWLPHTILFGDVRMRMTCEFAMIMLAGIGLDGLVGGSEKKLSIIGRGELGGCSQEKDSTS